jgi:uncharacterized protein YecE (DUF72 family)
VARRNLFVGTAGWSIPRDAAGRFDGEGTHLERYARVLNGVEINSSFHKPHAAKTYARWAASTPDDFRFSVKVPREITHDRRLVDVASPLDRFLDETAGLGVKRGPLLVQFPPSFAFDADLVARFLDDLRGRYDGPVVCEPRHPSWMTAAADDLLRRQRVARVAADPPRMGDDDRPGGWPGLVYYRWHGSPRVYWSRYDPARIDALAAALRSVPDDAETWCVFDNTAAGGACENALELRAAVPCTP